MCKFEPLTKSFCESDSVGIMIGLGTHFYFDSTSKFDEDYILHVDCPSQFSVVRREVHQKCQDMTEIQNIYC